MRINPRNYYSGAITIGILVWTAVFTIIIYAIAFYVSVQYNLSFRQIARDNALNIAEAGVNYYRWHLAHAPNDFKDGTLANGPYVHSYTDPSGSTLGTFSLAITPPLGGSSIATIKSTGWQNDNPNVKRTVTAIYGKPSMAQYAFLANAASWYGSGITVHGLIHSNTGIRMDGTNDSLVSNAQATYTCGQETGCSPATSKPGVWGAGGPSGLWQFPTTPIDFNAVSVDFAVMKAAAQSSGLYLGPSGNYGYHITFAADSTFTVRKITGTSAVNGYSVENGCQSLRQTITNQTLVGSYQLSTKPIVFAEDYLWVDGVVNGKTTLVAARFPIDSNNMNMWITNNLTYAARDGNTQLGLIAQKDIYFGLNVPTNFEIDAALLAQNGHIIRHSYNSSCGSYANAVRNSLTIYGAVISNQKSYWNWGSPPVSGFTTRNITYDSNLKLKPPPYFPTSGEYQFISWSE